MDGPTITVAIIILKGDVQDAKGDEVMGSGVVEPPIPVNTCSTHGLVVPALINVHIRKRGL